MFEAYLDCGHTTLFALKRLMPKKGSVITCRKHTALYAATVMGIGGGWTGECTQCQFRVDMQRSFADVRRLSRTHIISNRHLVMGYQNGQMKNETIKEIKVIERVQESLPF